MASTYSQYVKQTWPTLAPGATPPAAMFQHLEDGIVALSAQIVALSAAVADLQSSYGKYAAIYRPNY